MGKGAVGVMVEIHPDPDRVWSGGVLGLDSDLFQSVMKDRQRVAALVDRRL